MKLQKVLLSEIKDQPFVRNPIVAILQEHGINIMGAWEKYSNSIVDAEVIFDDDVNLYDYRIFDPYHKLGNLYTNFDGWTNWLCDYRDNQGNDVDTIFDEYDGKTQD